MSGKRTISYFDQVEIKAMKLEHNKLLSQRRFKESRLCGPKVIARKYGISVSRIHYICSTREQPYFPFVDCMG